MTQDALGSHCPKSQSLSDHLRSDGGQIVFTIPDGILPGFLIDAFNAAIKGELPRAAMLVEPENEAFIDRMMAEQWPGAMLGSVILAVIMQCLGRQEEALQRYEILCAIEPHPLLFNEQAFLHRSRGCYSQALPYSRRALDMAPDDQHIRHAHALDLICTGYLEQGLAVIKQQVEQGTVSAALHSELLFYSHFSPHLDPADLFREHVRWAQMHAPAHLARGHHSNPLDPDRCLRIAFLSATFCTHVAASQFEALLDGVNRDSLEVIGYGNVRVSDEVTARLAAKMSQYRSIYEVSDRTVADMIQKDEIDILVGVTGHARGHRLGVLAYKPAPIQVDWSCINTTGMSQVDYRRRISASEQTTHLINNRAQGQAFKTSDHSETTRGFSLV